MPRSNFQDTFTKTDNDKNLQYDDSAFFFFSSAILLILGITLLISILKQFWANKKVRLANNKTCDCINCLSKLSELAKFRKHSTSFYIKIGIMLLVLYGGYKSVSNAMESKSFKSFDPWEIMDLIPGTPKEEIKRKYKQLALKLHPDKNRDDENAVQKLILLNKAYTCLTDQERATNCGNFGNNESGNNAFEVGIALPSFLLRKKNRLIILALFFLLILVILPLGVLYFYQNSDNVDQNGISTKSLGKSIESFKNENILFKNFIEIIAQAEEMEPFLGLKKYQIRDLESLRDPEFQPKFGELKFRAYLKPFYLLHAFMNGKQIPSTLLPDLLEIIKVSYRVLDSLFELSIKFYMDRNFATSILGKPISFAIVERLTLFSQHFYQGMWLHDSSLLQMPNFRREKMDQIKRKLKKIEGIKEFRKLEDRIVKLNEVFGKDSTIDIKNDEIALDSISEFEISVNMFVEDSEGPKSVIFVGDVFTIRVEIKRKNKKVGFIHSNKFPFLKRETVLVMIFDGWTNSPVDYKKIISVDHVMSFEYREYARNMGALNWRIEVRSDCYVGIDEQASFNFRVFPRLKPDTELHQLHPDDEKALKETTFMSSLINDVQGRDVDSDEELEEPQKSSDKPKEIEGEIKENKR